MPKKRGARRIVRGKMALLKHKYGTALFELLGSDDSILSGRRMTLDASLLPDDFEPLKHDVKAKYFIEIEVTDKDATPRKNRGEG
jgi:hypothetical protein